MTSPGKDDHHPRAKPVRRRSPPTARAKDSDATPGDGVPVVLEEARERPKEQFDKDARLWWITFSASLASIIGGAVVLGISFAVIRAFRHLPPYLQAYTAGFTFTALVILGAVLWLGRGRLRKVLLPHPNVLSIVRLALVMAAALVGIFIIIGYLAGVR